MHYIQIWTGVLERRVAPRQEESKPSMLQRVKTSINAIKKLRPRDIVIAANRAVIKDPPRYYVFGALGLVYCLYPLLLLVAAGDIRINSSYSLELTLRLIGVFGCALLCFYDLCSENIKNNYLPTYWYFLLIWCLPMLASYSLILRYNDFMWVMHASMAVLMLAAFANYSAFLWLMLGGMVLGTGIALLQLYDAYPVTIPIADQLGHTTVVLLYLPLACVVAKEIAGRLMEAFRLATVDRLTGLYNRRYLDMNLANIIEDAHMSSQPLSIMMLDMDHFGDVNKKYDHQAGDMVLQELGHRLKNSLWPVDICARYGGEEFIIVLRGTKLEEASQTAERLRKIVEAMPFRIPHGSVPCTASIGVASLTPEESKESVLSRVDTALRAAKGSKEYAGRNRVVTSTNKGKLMLVSA